MGRCNPEVVNLGLHAIYPYITSVTCEATNPPSLGEEAFDECDNLSTIYVPSTAVDAYKAATN